MAAVLEKQESTSQQLTIKQQELVVDHLYLAKNAADYFGMNLPYDIKKEIYAEACLGLIQAALSFEDQGVPFQFFAQKRIRGAIKDLMRSESLGRLGRTVGDEIRRVDAARGKLEKTMGHASQDDISKGTGFPMERLGVLADCDMMRPRNTLSIDQVSPNLPAFSDRPIHKANSGWNDPFLAGKARHYVENGGLGLVPDTIVQDVVAEGEGPENLARQFGISCQQVLAICDWACEAVQGLPFDEMAVDAADSESAANNKESDELAAWDFLFELRRLLEAKLAPESFFEGRPISKDKERLIQQRMDIWEMRHPTDPEVAATQLKEIKTTTETTLSNVSRVMGLMHEWVSSDKTAREAFKKLYGYPPELLVVATRKFERKQKGQKSAS